MLDLFLRFPDLQHLHGGEPVGVHVQRSQLAVSRLRLSPFVLMGAVPRVGGVRGGGISSDNMENLTEKKEQEIS